MPPIQSHNQPLLWTTRVLILATLTPVTIQSARPIMAERRKRMAAKFELGQLLATPGVLEAAEQAGETLLPYLARHATGDWGIVDAEDKQANDRSLRDATRLLSAYLLRDGTKVWIITEADRSATTVLLPSEY